MKLANLFWVNTELNASVRSVNYGDILQLFIIDEILNKYFPDEKVERLSVRDVKEYTGEKLILPLNWSLFDKNLMDDDKLSISSDITPVFLSMTIESGTYRDDYINKFNLEYLKRFEPIGCRDEVTKAILQKNGIDAYLNGCLTITFGKREHYGNKVLLVDAPVEVKDYLPNWDCEVETFSQQDYFGEDYSIEDIRRIVKERYEYYCVNAKLVVTSRLHVVCPCLAAGIPVILTKNVIDARFPWLRCFIDLYDATRYDGIDWNPSAIDFEQKKKTISDLAVGRIRNELYGEKNIINVKDVDSMFYSNTGFCPSYRNTVNGLERILSFLNERFNTSSSFEYAIWGLGRSAEQLFDYIGKNYKNARLVAAIDMYKKGEFHGHQVVSVDDYKKMGNELVFVVPVQASNVAKEILIKKGFDDDKYVCAGDIFIKTI